MILSKHRFLFFGILFGLSFPIMGSLWAFYGQVGSLSIWELHLGNRLLQIIDLAPLVLGIFSYSLGASVDRRTSAERVLQGETQRREHIQRELAQQLQKQNADLRELNETLDGLVYTASHDLKTPIINFVSMLKMLRMVLAVPGSEKKVEEIIVRMEAATDRFQATISDLLEVSRVERLDVQGPTPIHLEPLLHTVVDSLAEFNRAQDAQFDIALAGDLALGTSASLTSIFQNLFTNAVKYRHPDRAPRIVVRSTQVGDRLRVTVADNGSGIDLARQGDKVFKMFTTFHASADGTGIGLYIVKRTLEKLGGTIAVASQVGEGTTFTLEFQSATTTTSQEK